MNKYKQAATLLQELFLEGEAVIDRLCETDGDAYVNKKQVDNIWFDIQPLEHIEEIVCNVITVIEEDNK